MAGTGDRIVVGITVSLDPGERIRRGVPYAYLKRAYARAVAAAGGVPILLVPESETAAVAACDAVVVSGGDDLPPRLGDATPAGATPEQPERIAWERHLLDACLAADVPLLAVCYGMQLLNLHLGGTLHAELEAVGGAGDHGGGGRFVEHGIALEGRHPALAGLGEDARVSSSHHQAIDRVAPGLEVLARAPDGLVEAVACGAALGVEWHPESDATAGAVYGWLVGEGRARR